MVFQYGSNMSSKRLNSPDRLCGAANFIGLAQTIDDFDINFTVWSKGNWCAAADLVPGARGRMVLGVLYEIPDHLLSCGTAGSQKSLDAIEGPRYRRHKIKVCTCAGPHGTHEAWTYTVAEKNLGCIHRSSIYNISWTD